MRTSSAAWLGLLVGILWVLTPTPARTSPLLELLGAPSSAASLDARLTGVGPEACYFNPTLLLYAREGLDVGFFVLGTSASIDLEPRPADADVPSAVYQSRVQNQDGTTSVLDVRPLPTADLEPRQGDADGGEPGIRSYVVLGALGHLVEGRVSMGFYAVVPTHAFQAQRAFFSDEREQYGTNSLHFELLGDRAENAVVSAGFGMKITDSLNVGGGAAFTFHSNARTPAFVPDSSDQRTILLNSDVSVDAIFAPHMAITWRPIERLELVATLHAPTSAEITGRNELKLWNYRYENGERSLLQTYEFVHTYMPARASATRAGAQACWAAGRTGRPTATDTVRRRPTHSTTPSTCSSR